MKDRKMKKFPKHAKQTILHLVKNAYNVKVREELSKVFYCDCDQYPEEVIRGFRTLVACAGLIINGQPSIIFMEAENISAFKGLPVDNFNASKIIRKAMMKVLGEDYNFKESLSFGENHVNSEQIKHTLHLSVH